MKIVYALPLLMIAAMFINASAEEEPVIKFDKTNYSLFDEVIITVKYDVFNRDPNLLDKISATLSTQDKSMKIEIVETASNSGLFLTTVKLSPNLQLYPGDLQVSRGDRLTLRIEFGNEVFEESVRVNFYTAKIAFDKQAYRPNEEGILRIVEPDANKNPYLIDSINVTMRSSKGEFNIIVNETDARAGIFETKIKFDKVDTKDVVIIDYIDDTLPPPADLNKDLSSTETSVISSRVIIDKDADIILGYIENVKDTAKAFASLVNTRGGLDDLLMLESVEPFIIVNNNLEGEGSITQVAEMIVDNTAFTTGDRAPITISEVARVTSKISEYKQSYQDALISPREWNRDETKRLLNAGDLILKLNWKSLNKDITTIAVLDDGKLEFEPMMYFTAMEPIVKDNSFIVKNYFGDIVVDAMVTARISSSDSCQITSNPNTIPDVDVWTAPVWLYEDMSDVEILTISKCLTDPEKDFECASIETIIAYGPFVPNWTLDKSDFRVVKGSLPLSSNDVRLRIQACPTTPTIETVRHAGSVFNVVTHQNNISIESITVDENSNALVLTLDAEQDGMLELTLPRELIDSKSNGNDADFVVIIDGEQVEFEQISSNDLERSIRIPIPSNSNELRIIGTQVVPEFGIIALMILAVMISLVIVSNRFRTNINA